MLSVLPYHEKLQRYLSNAVDYFIDFHPDANHFNVFWCLFMREVRLYSN